MPDGIYIPSVTFRAGEFRVIREGDESSNVWDGVANPVPPWGVDTLTPDGIYIPSVMFGSLGFRIIREGG
jgi:hypothetical protein